MNIFWHDGKVPNCLWEWLEATFSTCQNLLEMHERRCLYLSLDFCSLICTLVHSTFYPWCTSFNEVGVCVNIFCCGRQKPIATFWEICAAGKSLLQLLERGARQAKAKCDFDISLFPKFRLFLGQQPKVGCWPREMSATKNHITIIWLACSRNPQKRSWGPGRRRGPCSRWRSECRSGGGRSVGGRTVGGSKNQSAEEKCLGTTLNPLTRSFRVSPGRVSLRVSPGSRTIGSNRALSAFFSLFIFFFYYCCRQPRWRESLPYGNPLAPVLIPVAAAVFHGRTNQENTPK